MVTLHVHRRLVTASCPWCQFAARATVVSVADATLRDHLLARHRTHFVLAQVGLIDRDSKLLLTPDAKGRTTLPALWRLQRVS